MKNARGASFLGISLALIAGALIAIFISEELKKHAGSIIDVQNEYMSGYGTEIENHVVPAKTEHTSSKLRKLREANFFANQVSEPTSVQRVKQSLGAQYQNRYFRSVWELLWYLDFMGAESAYYMAVRLVIQSGALRESDDCWNFKDCEPTEKSVNLNNRNARRLFRILQEKYVDRAIKAFDDLALAEARQLIMDGANLSRQFRISTDTDYETSLAYNNIVLPLAFMSKYATSSVPNTADLRAVFDLVSDSERNSEKIIDKDIKAYWDGVVLMRAGCFIKASEAFQQGAASAPKGMLSELFSFMAMRSLARPFLEIYRNQYLSEGQTKPDSLLVYDCEENVDAANLASLFGSVEKKLKTNITHQGLSFDLAYYRNFIPFSPEATKVVLSSLHKEPGDNGEDTKDKVDQLWSWEGGVGYVVKQNDTLDEISSRYGVPSKVLQRLNGLGTSSKLESGQRLVIPRRLAEATQQVESPRRVDGSSEGQQPDQSATSSDKSTRISIAQQQAMMVQRALTEYGYANLRRTGVVDAETVEAIKKFERERRLPITGVISDRFLRELATLIGQPLVISSTGSTPSNSAPQTLQAPEATEANASKETGAGRSSSFQWPVRGVVIAAYHANINGKVNDGINLAVPVGTPVRAAADGTVAYAGNELKGYGNLILIRHEKGFVTAYAHAEELLVKRGDTVKRGQIIAKSGQSGGVDNPQLHFEVRKGALPVDPAQFLD